MKKLIVALLLVCLVATAIGIGTWAFFSDYETSSNNVFCAGDLDLKVDGNDTDITYFEIECMKPGDSGLVQLTLENVGCVDGVTDFHIKNLIDHENGVIEPEAEGSWYGGDNPLVGTDLPCEGDSGNPDMTAGPFEGELSQYLEMQITADMDNSGDYETLVVPRGNLTDIACINYIYGDLPAETMIGLQIEWWLPETVCNIIMTDCVTFDMEFSLNQKVGEVIGNVTDIIQEPYATEGFPYNYQVEVHNAGTIAGNFWVTVVIMNEAGTAVVTKNMYVENLAPCEYRLIDLSWTPPAGSSGNYRVIAGDIVCPFVVQAPPELVMTAITQPPTIQVCEELIVQITITNNGDIASEPQQAWTGTCRPNFNPIFMAMPFNVPAVDPGASETVTVNLGHVPELWRGLIWAVAAFDLTAPPFVICPVTVQLPGYIEVVGIQQEPGYQVCEEIMIGVDVHNMGDKPIDREITLVLSDETGLSYLTATSLLTTFPPCETIKVWFGPFHAGQDVIEGTTTVTTDPPLPPELTPHTIVVAAPAELIVVGFQQPPEVPYCEEVMIGIDVHNIGGKPILAPVDFEIRNLETGSLVAAGLTQEVLFPPCEIVKVWIGPFHVGDLWLGGPVGAPPYEQNPGTNLVQILNIPAPEHIIIGVPPPEPISNIIPPVNSTWSYLVDFQSNDPGLPITETDQRFDVTMVAQGVYPDNTDCRPCTNPALCPNQFVTPAWYWQDFGLPPQTLSYHLDWNTNYPASIYQPPQRVMALFGNNMGMQMQALDWWMNMQDGTEVFETDHMIPPIPGFVVDFEMANFADDYDGVQPGWPYDPIPSERWTSTWTFGGKVAAGSIFTGCVPPWPYWIHCHVEGTETITVPAGTYSTVHIHCEYIFSGWDDDEDARDDDADGYCTGQELVEGSNPYDASSTPASGVPEDPLNYIDEDPADGVDNDGDGFVDEDQVGQDNDGDGLWDEDGDEAPALPGVDEDGDTFIDEDPVEDPIAAPPPAHGSRDIWWSETLGIMVKQINNNTPYYGVENMELNTEP